MQQNAVPREAGATCMPPRLVAVQSTTTAYTMKNFDPPRPRGPLAVAAFALSVLTMSVFVMLPLAVESHVPELSGHASLASCEVR